MPAPFASPAAGRLQLTYAGTKSGGAAPAVALSVPWLAGATQDALFAGAEPAGTTDGFSLYGMGGLLIGHGVLGGDERDLETTARELYRRLFRACRARHLYRVWNFVPAINGAVAGLENYRTFSKGRSVAFEEEFGAGFERELSAASAVGSAGRQIEMIFVAGEDAGRHIENPEQVPAYHYPAEHGPRAPSFARATVASAGGREFVFVSGTAAIKGHASVAPGNLAEQLPCTLDNLRLISRAAGLGERLRFDGACERHFKVYLRRAEDLAAARAVLERELLGFDDHVSYLRADVCRAELVVEIEATIVR